jgi:hypothetical protein
VDGEGDAIVSEHAWKLATIVSLKGLKRRSRDSFVIGARVLARVETCTWCEGDGCDACEGGKTLILKEGAFPGISSHVPMGMVEFLS